MKSTTKDLISGGAFALIYNLASIGLVSLLNFCGAEVLLIPLPFSGTI